jgi:hypothetical protein
MIIRNPYPPHIEIDTRFGKMTMQEYYEKELLTYQKDKKHHYYIQTLIETRKDGSKRKDICIQKTTKKNTKSQVNP